MKLKIEELKKGDLIDDTVGKISQKDEQKTRDDQ